MTSAEILNMNPRYVRCEACLLRKPTMQEFQLWIARRWAEFAVETKEDVFNPTWAMKRSNIEKFDLWLQQPLRPTWKSV